MYCLNCGKEIKEGSGFCPYCGAPQNGAPVSQNYEVPQSESPQPENPQNTNRPYNVLCIVGFAVSLISLILSFYGIVGIAGIVISVIGLVNCRQNNQRGTVFAIVGIVIGTLSILYSAIVMMGLF